MSDPLRWWPGKYLDCKRIAQLVQEFADDGEVLEYGGLGIFAELLPQYHVTTAPVAGGARLRKLPYDDDHFDISVSARVVELLPPPLRMAYVRELLRVTRYRAFLALPLLPELEAIDKLKNTYLWDTTRVWQHPALRPQDLERWLERQELSVAFHVEAPNPADLAQLEASRELIEAMLLSPKSRALDPISDLPAPSLVVAEIAKSAAWPPMLATLGQEAH